MSFDLKQDVDEDCVICCEPLNHDLNFYPCSCGFQLCSMCWHRIKNDEDNRCPNCRELYGDEPFKFSPLTTEQDRKLKELRAKEASMVKTVMPQKPKPPQTQLTNDMNRERLAQVRVMQKNLVFVVGLSAKIAEEAVLRRSEYFGKFGKILKVAVNQSTSYAGTQGPSASAYVTYNTTDAALKCILDVNGSYQDGRTLKATLGTTKYCSRFLNGQVCKLTDCMYLHEVAEEEASFTKEDMSKQKHSEYEKSLMEAFLKRQKEKQEKERADAKQRQMLKAQQEAEAKKRAEMLRLQNKRQAEKARAETAAKKIAPNLPVPAPQPSIAQIAAGQVVIAKKEETQPTTNNTPLQPKNKKERAKARREKEKVESKKKADAEKKAMEYKDPEEEKGEEEVRDAWDSSDEDVELEKTVSPTLTSSSSAPSSKTPSRQATPTANAAKPKEEKKTKKSEKEKKNKKETKKEKKTIKEQPITTTVVQTEVTPPPQVSQTPPTQTTNQSQPNKVPTPTKEHDFTRLNDSPPMSQTEAIAELKKLQEAENLERAKKRALRKETPEEELFQPLRKLTPSPPIINKSEMFLEAKVDSRKASFDFTKFDPFAKSPASPSPPSQQQPQSRLIFHNGINSSDEQHISRPESNTSAGSSHHSHNGSRDQFIAGLPQAAKLPGLSGLPLFSNGTAPSLLPQLDAKPLTPPGMTSTVIPSNAPPGLASKPAPGISHDIFARPKPPSVENKRPTKSFDPFDFGAFKSRPMMNGTSTVSPPQPQNNQRPVQRRPDPFGETAFRQPPPPGFMHDRKDPLDWDLNGSSQSGGDFPRLNFNRQHSQGAPQQQAPPPPPPQFNRQLSNDIFGHVPNGLENGHRFGRRKIQKSEDELDFDPSQFALEQIRIDGLSRGLDDLSMSNNNRQMAPQKQRLGSSPSDWTSAPSPFGAPLAPPTHRSFGLSHPMQQSPFDLDPSLSRMRQPPPNPQSNPSNTSSHGFEDIFKKLMPNANLNFGSRTNHHQTPSSQTQGEMLRPSFPVRNPPPGFGQYQDSSSSGAHLPSNLLADFD